MRDNDIFLRSLGAMNGDNRYEPCSVHGPILIYALEEDTYVALCLTCGMIGPERGDGWEAKLAFDEYFRSAG
jgi:hypothetical protein